MGIIRLLLGLMRRCVPRLHPHAADFLVTLGPLGPVLGASEAYSSGIHNFPEMSVGQEAATKEAGTQHQRMLRSIRGRFVRSSSRDLP